jgi:hypothetical protein
VRRVLVLGSAVVVIGCGGQSANDIASGIDDAIRAAKPAPEIRIPQTIALPEQETESAAKRAICNALGAYSAEPAQALSGYIADYAERQRVLAEFNLNEIDPGAAGRLAEAADDISDTQEAAEVGDELGCG